MPKSKLEMLESRPDIVSLAQKIFHERGYDSTSVQEVADAVGLLKGSLYHYIASKDDLLFVILQQVHSQMTQRWLQSDPGDTPVARIEVFVHTLISFTVENLEAVSLCLREFRSLSAKRRDLIVGNRDEYESRLMRLVIEAQTAGDIDHIIDSGLATRTIFGMMNGVTHWCKSGKNYIPERLADELAVMALSALGVRTVSQSSSPTAAG